MSRPPSVTPCKQVTSLSACHQLTSLVHSLSILHPYNYSIRKSICSCRGRIQSQAGRKESENVTPSVIKGISILILTSISNQSTKLWLFSLARSLIRTHSSGSVGNRHSRDRTSSAHEVATVHYRVMFVAFLLDLHIVRFLQSHGIWGCGTRSLQYLA